MTHLRSIFVIVFLLICNSLFAQTKVEEPTLLLNKQGTFKVIDWGVYTHYDCGFKKTETDANYKKLIAITDAVRKNPVMSDLKGFDGQARFFAKECDDKLGYGIPSRISFEFCAWFLYKGEEEKSCIEPPHWDILLNKINSIGGAAYGYTAFKPWGNVREGFNFELWESAAEKVNEIFFCPANKQTLAPGVDLYKESDIVLYNPERPAYWMPVTIRESFDLLYNYWKLRPDLQPDDPMVKELDDEYADFTETEKDGYAHSGGRGFLSQISADEKYPIMMRVNTAYWNKNLPRSAIQIISFYCPVDKEYTKSMAERWLKHNSSGYHSEHFIETLDYKLLIPVVDK